MRYFTKETLFCRVKLCKLRQIPYFCVISACLIVILVCFLCFMKLDLYFYLRLTYCFLGFYICFVFLVVIWVTKEGDLIVGAN